MKIQWNDSFVTSENETTVNSLNLKGIKKHFMFMKQSHLFILKYFSAWRLDFVILSHSWNVAANITSYNKCVDSDQFTEPDFELEQEDNLGQ